MELVNNLHQAEALLWEALMDAVGANKESSPPMVRRSWNINGAPDWGIDDNVIFMQVTEEGSDDITQPIDSILNDKGNDYVMLEGMTRVLTLQLVAYGSNAYSNLLKIRRLLIRGVKKLRQNKIHVVPAPDIIQHAPENFQGRWWERCDTRLRFNWLIITETDVNRIAEVRVNVKLNKPGDSTKVIDQEIIIKERVS